MYFKKFYSPTEFEGAKFEDFTVTRATQTQAPVQEPETVIPPTETASIVDIPEEVVTPAEVTPDVTPAEQPAPTTAPVVKTETAPVAAKSWKDLLKDDGFDDTDLAMLEHRKKTGSYKDYLEAISVNYKDMPAEEIARRDLREQYPSLSADNLERLYRKQVVEKYSLDPEKFEEDEVALGKELFEFDMNQKRQKFLEKQSAFTIPDKDIAGEQQRHQEEQQRQMTEQQEAIKQSIVTNPVTKNLMANKKIVFDGGDGVQFNYEVENPNELVDLLLDPQKYQEVMSTKDTAGNSIPDFQKTMLLAAVAKNPQAVIKALINHGKSLGKGEFFNKELVNAEQNGGVTAVTGELSLGDAFLRNGVRRNF